MHSAKKKGERGRLRSFLHRHHHHHRDRRQQDASTTTSGGDPQSALTPQYTPKSILRSQSSSPPKNAYPNSKFSADYERYMSVRKMNMDRIKEYNSNPNNYSHSTSTSNNYNYATTTQVPPLEQELLDFVNYERSLPYSSSTYNNYTLPPTANASPILVSPSTNYWTHTLPKTQSTSSLPSPSLPLSPLTELERFRCSFNSQPSSSSTVSSTSSYPTYHTSTTSSYVPDSTSSWGPSSSYQYNSYYDNKPTYKAAPDYSAYYDIPSSPYEHQHEGPRREQLRLSTEYANSVDLTSPSLSDFNFKPSEDESLPPVYDYKPLPPTTAYSEPLPSIVKDRPMSPVVEDEPRPIVEEDVPQVLVEDQDGRQISLQEDLENLLQNLELHFKRPPSEFPKAPPPSPADFLDPIESDYFTPPQSPPQAEHVEYSPALPPPPLPSTPSHSHSYNIQELDCQGNFPAPPPPLAFNDSDLQVLNNSNLRIPPPDFDYSLYDFQGNRLDRTYDEDEEELEQMQVEEEEEEQAEAEHTSSFTTSTTRDDYSTTVSAVMTSNTTSPSTSISTISTATTTTTNTAIPTSPTTTSIREPIVIQSLSTITTAVEAETGHVANSTITKMKISHPLSSSTSSVTPSSAEITNVEYEEGYLDSPVRPASVGNLLEEIRNGKILRKTVSANALSMSSPSVRTHTRSVSSPSLSSSPARALISGLSSRRAHISSDDDEELEEDELDWWV